MSKLYGGYTLEQLIEMARHHQWTEEEKKEAVISFAWANLHLDGSRATLEDVRRAYEELYDKS